MPYTLDAYSEFAANGYIVIPNALTAEELVTMNDVVDRDRARCPRLWQNRGGGCFHSVSILLDDNTLLTGTLETDPSNRLRSMLVF